MTFPVLYALFGGICIFLVGLFDTVATMRQSGGITYRLDRLIKQATAYQAELREITLRAERVGLKPTAITKAQQNIADKLEKEVHQARTSPWLDVLLILLGISVWPLALMYYGYIALQGKTIINEIFMRTDKSLQEGWRLQHELKRQLEDAEKKKEHTLAQQNSLGFFCGEPS